MIKYVGKCGDCIYAKPSHEKKPLGEQECGWNHRRFAAEHECEMHSFFPKKTSIGRRKENEEIFNET